MEIALDLRWLLGALLISVRLAALLLMSPLLSLGRVPARVLLLLILMFAVALNSTLGQYAALTIHRIDDLLIAAVRELAVGALMAFGLHCAFAAFSFGGRVLDLQIGFGVANLLNPSTNEQAPLLGTALMLLGVMTFWLLGGHHWVARSVVQSYLWFPLAAPLPAIAMSAVMAQFGVMFSLGFMLVSPVVLALLLVDGAMAVAARTMPQMNVFVLSIPIKIALGLTVLLLTLTPMRAVFERIFASIFTYWGALV